ncbi:MAG: transporter substrate-binding domain-containing protein [Deltaproteobacteria bacterium]|nr:transporter substrate-binding domain-containing protein [Deltaproteobacteria bacterium]
MKLFLFLSCILWVLLASAPLRAQEKLHICTNNYEPYYGETMPGFGPVIKITRLVFSAVGYDVEVRFSPWARVLKDAKSGRCDVIAGVWFDTGRTDWMALTDAILVNENGLYKRKDDKLVFQGYADLKSKEVVVGTVRGYISPKGLDEAGLGTEEVSEDLLNMKKLIKGRIRLALVDKQVGMYLLKKSGDEHRVAWLVTLQKLPLHNAVIKTAKGDWKRRLDDFNRGLALLASRGIVSNILKEHQLQQ